jgi:hypothetical protein
MYCPNCAGVIEAGQTACPRCGSAIAITGPGPARMPAAMRPKAIRSGIALLVVSLAATLFYFLIALGRYPNLPFLYSAQTGAFLLIWAVLLLLAWRGQGWTRIAMIALIVYNLGNISYAILRQSAPALVLVTAYAVPLLIQALRAVGVALLFAPAARNWFSVRTKP